MRKYEYLTSGPNFNNVTVSVKDSIAPEVNAALGYLLRTLRFSKSQVVCDAILEHAERSGFVFEDQDESAKAVC